eukprot:350172-Chlamydomonas_euryale.AAC.5
MAWGLAGSVAGCSYYKVNHHLSYECVEPLPKGVAAEYAGSKAIAALVSMESIVTPFASSSSSSARFCMAAVVASVVGACRSQPVPDTACLAGRDVVLSVIQHICNTACHEV